MKTRNAMQLKALINNKAKAANVSPQLMLQNYMLERLIERISLSKSRDKIVVKGGMLIGSLIGVDKRTTKDLDATVIDFALSHEMAAAVFKEICAIDVDDDLEFELLRTENIREVDEYPGIRVHLKAKYSPLAVPLTIDVTTGDKITPSAIIYKYPFAFDKGYAEIMAYPLETVLAEKLEAVLSRNIATTRLRDFYDVYELWRVKGQSCDKSTLGAALAATCMQRNSVDAAMQYESVVGEMIANENLYRQWDIYTSKHSYAEGISFESTLDTVDEIMAAIREDFLSNANGN